jgi:uncharacterized protein YjiS (DUF1127 family)
MVEYISSVARRISGAVLQWRERRIGLRTLEALNDHNLKDIGIERSDLPSYVTKALKRDEYLR